MTSVASGSSSKVFYSKKVLVDHLLKNILANKKRKIGTEWEMLFIKPEFLSDPNKKSFTCADGQKAFIEFKRVFKLHGYKPQYIFEREGASEKIVGVEIPTLGAIVPEAGHQFEFSCSVCNTAEEVREKNEDAHRAIMEVASRLNYIVAFKGHVPGFAGKTERMERSRSLEWGRYYDSDHFSQEDRRTLHETQDGTASVQVTVDSGAENFHEFYQALLLLEPALTFHYTNSDRSYIGMHDYGKLIPSQVEPIVNVWKTKSPRDALEAIVDRLMEIDVPFLPDLDRDGLYKAEQFINGLPPTVQDIMEEGRLSEKMLNNIGGFFYTRPALKNFSQALLEVRGVDSQSEPDTVAEVARRVCSILYNDRARKDLLEDYSCLTREDIQKLHEASTFSRKEDALGATIFGITMAAFAEDIIARSEAALSSENLQFGQSAITTASPTRTTRLAA